jgi:hypothetical protein
VGEKSFTDEDFIVFVEMLEHDEVANLSDKNQNPQDCSANLQLTARVVVVDNRTDSPHIILQEVVNDKHFIPRQFNRYNFRQVAWGSMISMCLQREWPIPSSSRKYRTGSNTDLFSQELIDGPDTSAQLHS